METHPTLGSIRELILREYYASGDSLITYARRLPVRGPNTSPPPPHSLSIGPRTLAVSGTALTEILETCGAADRAEPWKLLLARSELVADSLFCRISECPEPSLPEFLICRPADSTPTKRFINHLRMIGRYLIQSNLPSAQVPTFSRILNFCLFVASNDPVGDCLEVRSYFIPQSGGDLQPSDRQLNLATLADYARGQLDWPPGDYFFVLEGDARVGVALLLDAFLKRHSALIRHPTGLVLTGPMREILWTLDEADQRLTTSKLLAAMRQAGRDRGISTVKSAMPRLIESGLVDNRRDVRPRGYGITERGKAELFALRSSGRSMVSVPV